MLGAGVFSLIILYRKLFKQNNLMKLTMEATNNEILNELKKLRIDVNLIKGKLDEGELTEFAKSELSEARKRDEKISHARVKELILSK